MPLTPLSASATWGHSAPTQDSESQTELQPSDEEGAGAEGPVRTLPSVLSPPRSTERRGWGTEGSPPQKGVQTGSVERSQARLRPRRGVQGRGWRGAG